MVLLVALGSALCYAVASVLQQQAAAGEPEHRSLRPSLLLHLLARPRWLLGVAADVAGYALQVVALAHGSLVMVQPLLVSGLLFALPLSAMADRRRMGPSEWIGAVELAGGLALFLVAAAPARGHPHVSVTVWAVILALTLVPAGVLALVAGPAGPRRAMLLGTATGLLYGLTAALTKSSEKLFSRGAGHALAHWEPYALVVVGLAGMIAAQSAFQAGSLASSLPMLTVVDPLVSIAIGAFAFGESLNSHGLAPLFEVVGLAAMVAGVFKVARSQLVTGLENPAPTWDP